MSNSLVDSSIRITNNPGAGVTAHSVDPAAAHRHRNPQHSRPPSG
jgi:hypothetical protein